MEKQERHQIKENDFLTVLTNSYEFYLDHQKQILYALAALVAVLVLAYGWSHFSGGREKHAANLLAQALSGDKVDMEKLKLVSQKYSSFPAGKSAAVLLALQEGKSFKDTAQVLEKYVPKIKDDVFRGMVIYNAVILLAEAKDFDGAGKLLDEQKEKLPGEMTLFLQARIQEIKGNIVDARALYNRLVREFPESTLRYLAQQRVNVL
jgi:predicted negative regulator of RcsB-dependent stress response